MADWTAGYMADIGYTYGYYPELNPVAAQLALATAGIAHRPIRNACELGFGQGVSINFHAAAGEGSWWGTDFNPSQAAFAQELAQASGADAHLSDEAFAEFCARDDLPEMDYIALHGIWSWIDDANRRIIVDFVRRKLRPAGVLYVSYNSQPGWSIGVPLRDLLVRHAEIMAAPGEGIVSRIDGALAFAERLHKTGPRFFKANPQAAERLKHMSGQDRHYLAHEFFNRHWTPMSFAEMAEILESAKMDFACSAAFLDHVDGLHLTPEQTEIVEGIQDPVFKQTVRDYCINQQFRKDYWVKGARPLNPMIHRELMGRQRFVLVALPKNVNLALPGATGEVKLAEAIYAPLLEALQDHQPHSLSELAQKLRAKSITGAQLLQALVVLAGLGHVQPAQPEPVIEQARERTRRLNRQLVSLARGSNSVSFLASPVTGGGRPIHRFHQLFLAARADGMSKREDWVRQAWESLSVLGHRLIKDGRTLSTPQENMAELDVHAGEFIEALPLYDGLKLL